MHRCSNQSLSNVEGAVRVAFTPSDRAGCEPSYACRPELVCAGVQHPMLFSKGPERGYIARAAAPMATATVGGLCTEAVMVNWGTTSVGGATYSPFRKHRTSASLPVAAATGTARSLSNGETMKASMVMRRCIARRAYEQDQSLTKSQSPQQEQRQTPARGISGLLVLVLEVQTRSHSAY